MQLRAPRSPLFPYTTLFRSIGAEPGLGGEGGEHGPAPAPVGGGPRRGPGRDRKSTRLNSSHRCISYAVFCLKKKKNTSHSQTTHHDTVMHTSRLMSRVISAC